MSASSDNVRLAVEIDLPNGTTERWGGDENPESIPQNITATTSDPGGFKDCSLTLTRSVNREWPDLQLFLPIRLYGPGNKTVWEGRISQLPIESSATGVGSWNIGAVGWQAHMTDNKSFREIYVDQDLGNWQAPSLQRQINLGSAWALGDTNVVADPGGKQALQQQISGAWAGHYETVEATYLSPVDLGQLHYGWLKSASIDHTDTNWSWHLGALEDDIWTGATSTGNLRAAGPVNGQTYTIPAGHKGAFASLSYPAAPAGTDGTDYWVAWLTLAVYGRHGLTLYPTGTGSEAPGVLASDVLTDVVGRMCPLIRVSPENIYPTGFAIPQLAFKDPTTAFDVLQTINAYHLWQWGVWENRELVFRPVDPARQCWTTSQSEGATISLEGQASDDVINGIIIQYTDFTGAQKTIGPVGSGCTEESTYLTDDSPYNAVNASVIPKKWDVISLSQPTTNVAAEQIGRLYLAEQLQPKRKGQIVLPPIVNGQPCWMIRAGDHIKLTDQSDTPRRIVETSYDHNSRRLTASIDSTANKVEALLERLGATLQRFGN